MSGGGRGGDGSAALGCKTIRCVTFYRQQRSDATNYFQNWIKGTLCAPFWRFDRRLAPCYSGWLHIVKWPFKEQACRRVSSIASVSCPSPFDPWSPAHFSAPSSPRARYTSLAPARSEEVYFGALQSLMHEHKHGNATWPMANVSVPLCSHCQQQQSCPWAKLATKCTKWQSTGLVWVRP